MSPGSNRSSDGGGCRSMHRGSPGGHSTVPVPYTAFMAAAKALNKCSAALSASLAASQTVTFSEKLLRQESSCLLSHASLGASSAADAVAPWAAAAFAKAPVRVRSSQPSGALTGLAGAFVHACIAWYIVHLMQHCPRRVAFMFTQRRSVSQLFPINLPCCLVPVLITVSRCRAAQVGAAVQVPRTAPPGFPE